MDQRLKLVAAISKILRPKCHFRPHILREQLLVGVLKYIANPARKLCNGVFFCVPITDQNLTTRWLQQPIKVLNQSRFPRTILPDNGNLFARINDKRNPIERLYATWIRELQV